MDIKNNIQSKAKKKKKIMLKLKIFNKLEIKIIGVLNDIFMTLYTMSKEKLPPINNLFIIYA